tara:strand:+ start:78 stop:1082 length:1005 start_codon:yes stop_codon:yes gene_type:complete
MNYSVVIPSFKRSDILIKCLSSILNQTLKPFEILIVDNNTSYESKKLFLIVEKFKSQSFVNIRLLKSTKNSGSLARNIGAKNSNCELIAFLDNDVILDKNYYKILIKYFCDNPELIAIQGVDMALIESQRNDKSANFLKKFFFRIEQFMETGNLFNKTNAYVSPSLSIAHPNVLEEFEVDSQWISTCAGIFKKKLFLNYSFPNQFITYSNNEYIFFSYSLFKNNEGKMLYTSKAKYRDVQTKTGRINTTSLIYQIQAYDYYIFLRLFELNSKNLFIFFKSRFGHLILNIFRLLKKRDKSLVNYFHAIACLFYPIFYLKDIIKGDLSFYEKHFMK